MNARKTFVTFIFVTHVAIVHGCVGGYVYDTSGDPLQGATVMAEAFCRGNGCDGHKNGDYYVTTTYPSGLFGYDAYGELSGSDNIMILAPKIGEETIKFHISKPGFNDETIEHTPKYMEETINGQLYQVTRCPDIYLCPIGATDSDFDGLCDEAEAHYGTDPFNSDTDGDSLSDKAEIFGYGGLDLRFYGADPLHRDIFLEMDYYPGLKPSNVAIDKVIDAFANAPTSNPDGTTGIRLHVVVDDQIAAADVDNDLNPVWTDFDPIKNKYFKPNRSWAFHYVLIANQILSKAYSGISREIPSNDIVISMGLAFTPGGTIQEQAGTYMHELGHNLGLQHGGNDSHQYKANYISIMNYSYQMPGLTVDGVTGVVDYSRVQIAAVNEQNLSEASGFSPVVGSPTTEADLAHYAVWLNSSKAWVGGNASVNLDFNNNGVIDTGIQLVDLDGNGVISGIHRASWNDWENIVFHGGGKIGDNYLNIGGGGSRIIVPQADMIPDIAPAY